MNLLSRPASKAAGAVAALALALGGAGLAAGQAANPAAPAPGGSAPAPATDSGRVIAKGPGYSIIVTSPGTGNAAARPGQARVTDAPLETLHQPIVCQGERVLHIDNRDLRFEGNAITAEDGCEVHITNSRISAGGIAIRAHNASVHIENSEIEGGRASIEATGKAQIYAETSTFKGAARRVAQASIHDLGNNIWQ
jgi:hypothetical protein